MSTTTTALESSGLLGISADAPPAQSAAKGRSRFRTLANPWRLFKRNHAKASAEPLVEDLGPDLDLTGGLHEVIKGCDVSFGIEATQVENRAHELAKATAAASLPRIDVEYDEVAEETELAAQCRAAFHNWENRVRTKVKDAVQQTEQALSADLRRFDHELSTLESSIAELPVRQDELKIAESEAEAGRATLEYRPFMSKWFYFVLIGSLVIIDWIANVPVFAELLPKDPFSEDLWRSIAGKSEQYGLWAGLYRTGARAAHNIDASLLALGLIIVLVWIAHAFGESLRRLLAHSADEDPTAVLTIRGQRRQALPPVLLAAVCMVLVICVLWEARDRLGPATAQRVSDVQAKIEAEATALSTAEAEGDLQKIGDHQQEIAEMETLLQQRVEAADYASTITSMNVPILLLNIALAITAALAAYLSTRGTVDGVIVSPRVAELRRHVTQLRLEIGRRRVAIGSVDTDIDRRFVRHNFLAASNPLAGWTGKAERLEAIVPSFRSENARLRGVDVARIAAFHRPVRLDLRPKDEPVVTTTILDQYRQIHEALRRRFVSAQAMLDGYAAAPEESRRPADA